jgi:hypothetical protein
VEEVQRNLVRVILKTSLLNPFVLSKGWPLLSRNRDETGTLDEARSTTVQPQGVRRAPQPKPSVPELGRLRLHGLNE